MRRGRTEQHAVRHDGSATPTDLQHPKEQREEKKVRLFRLADLKDVCRDDIVVQASLERRIR